MAKPTVRKYSRTKYHKCGWDISLDLEKQFCMFQKYKDHRIDWQRDDRIPRELKINYDRVVGKPKGLLQPASHRLIAAPGLLDERRDDRFCNPMDWSMKGHVAVALRNSVYIINVDANQAEPKKLLTVGSGEGPGEGPVTGVAWSPNGHLMALGFRDSWAESAVIHLWDAVCGRWVGDLLGGVGQDTVLSWRGYELNVLTFGGLDGSIICRDIRMPLLSPTGIVRSFNGGHRGDVSALRWSPCGDRLASGDKDGVVCIWDIHMGGRWVHTFQEESCGSSSNCNQLSAATAAVRAICWSSVHTHDLAASRGSRVCLLDTNHGYCFGDTDTGSELSGLAWGANQKLFLTTHSSSGQGKGLVYWRRGEKGLVRTLYQPPIRSDVFFTAQSSDLSMMALGLVDGDTCEERVEMWKIAMTCWNLVW